MKRWQEAEHLFEAAIDLPPDTRERFLQEACGGDSELLRDVEDLLAADGKNGEGILAAIELEAQSLFGRAGLKDSRIGAYRIVSEIGRGGMSTVYLAVRDDDQFQKQVAIKLIRRGMDTEDVLSRFRHERQILANLEHPYISRLLDGGTAPDGRPFLVMEYLHGEALDAYCQTQRLDLRARCRLFLKVCEAVSFAHRNLVVHRDLKPGNILVDASGSPKLLDFGVAKLLDPETAAGQTPTVVTMRPMTPDYASPEQFRGEAITTAADVYSLGAVLYQLLTGQRPHRFSSYTLRELERVICETPPPRPSDASTEWRHALEGDLDAIVAKAMRKEPAMRYASVDDLAADLERYLAGWPVHARQGDFVYRSRKFLRRNHLPIAAGAVLAATLVAGATAAMIQARRADRERLRAVASQSLAETSRREARMQAAEAERQRAIADEQRGIAETQRGIAEAQRRQAEAEKAEAEAQRQIADRRFEQVHQLAGKFLLDFNDSINKLPGSTSARKMVVETGLKYFDTLVGEAHGNRDLLEEIARGYDRLGDVQGNPYEANLGDAPGALASYRKAEAIRERISDPSPEFLNARITGKLKIAELLLVKTDTAGAEPVLQAAFALARSPAASGGPLRAKLSDVYSHYGDLKGRAGLFPEAIAPYSQALAILTSLNASTEFNYKISVAHSKLAEAFVRTEQAPEALTHVRAALAIDEPRLAANPNNLTSQRKVFLDYILLGYVYLSDSGQDLDAGHQEPVFEHAAVLADSMAGADAKDARSLTDVRSAQTSWGDYLRDHNDGEGALLHYRRLLEVSEKLAVAAPQSSEGSLMTAHHRMARGLIVAGRPAEALEQLRQAEAYLAQMEKPNPGLTEWLRWRTNLLRAKGLAYAGMKNWPEAIAAYRAEMDTAEEIRRRVHYDGDNVYELRIGYAELAACYAAAEQWKEASQAMQSSLDALQETSAHRALRPDEQQAHAAGLTNLTAWKR